MSISYIIDEFILFIYVFFIYSMLNMQTRFLSLAGLAKQCTLIDIAPVGKVSNIYYMCVLL